jgi:diaminohydroxyphosphoribosylaminopyrimidine deaminase / 5-amino-6-(5-phosphoribosylamino)uracil reductase
MNHEHFIHQCIALAEKGRGLVGSNPLVGSVLVRGDSVIAEGSYMGQGTPHAERQLLENYDGDITPDDVLYVNLEPCCHQGSTPPCTDIIIQKGIQTVVVGMKDPDARVAGQGTKALRDAGIKIIGPVLPDRCRRLNKGFVSLRENSRPYITLKRAQTKQGVTANADGTKLCITSEKQNIWSHTHLRTTHDAILVGVQTVITDDPDLTIRLNKDTKKSFPQPTPIILDPDFRIPRDAIILREGTVVVTTKDPEECNGATVLQVPLIDGEFDLENLWNQLPLVSSILVEGGEKTWDAFRNAGMFDEEVVLVG